MDVPNLVDSLKRHYETSKFIFRRGSEAQNEMIEFLRLSNKPEDSLNEVKSEILVLSFQRLTE